MQEPVAIRTGLAAVKRPGGLIGRSWAPKELVLAPDALIIRPPPTRTRRTRTTALPLASITALERVDLTPCCLALSLAPTTGKGKRYYFSFDSDAALYDWQEDIYARAPLLGGYSSAPFNFVHEAHVGYESGTDAYAEMVAKAERAPLKNATNGPGHAQVGSTSKLPVANAPPAAPALDEKRKNLSIDEGASDSGTILSGLCSIKQEGSLTGGWFWRTRWLVLTPRVLAIHRSQNAPLPTHQIPLTTLASIERVVHRRPYCLLLETTGKRRRYYLSFESDRELYAWNDAVYLHLHGGGEGGAGDIGLPTSVVHRMHVGVDAKTGEFTSLPPEWRATLQPHLLPPSSSNPTPSSSPPSHLAPNTTKSKRASTQSQTHSGSTKRHSKRASLPPATKVTLPSSRAEQSIGSVDTLIER